VSTKIKKHTKFIEYQKQIIHKYPYNKIPFGKRENGEPNWVTASMNDGKRAARENWWLSKQKELKMNQNSEVARYLFKKYVGNSRPCGVCGQELVMDYVYPNKNFIKKLKFAKIEASPLETINEVLDRLKVHDIVKFKFFVKNNFKIEALNVECIITKIPKTLLSPGAMSNAPDRLDGFHTYNICCRSLKDKGRSKENLSRYNQDRRAYEHWSEGNLILGNRIMGEYNAHEKKYNCPSCGLYRKMTADHIGPISLGFKHSEHFAPLCRACNSKKNNRMTLADIRRLILIEKNTKKSVANWYTKLLWDALKIEVKTDKQAKYFSNLLAKNVTFFMGTFSELSKIIDKSILLDFLNKTQFLKRYNIKNFHPFEEIKYEERKVTTRNTKKNMERYVRISFETLEKYSHVTNRKNKSYLEEKLLRKFIMLNNSSDVKIEIRKVLKDFQMSLIVAYKVKNFL